ncbi:MAG: peptide deformylase [Syntrophales bacterium]|nr:peptide deformylase [Syntrophales bacterium]
MNTVPRVLTLWQDGESNEEDARVLRAVSAEVPLPLQEEDRRDIKLLITAFLERDDAAGLSAPQIGINKRIIIFRNKGFEKDGTPDGKGTKRDVEVLVNPRITQARGEPVVLAEGCLSCPEVRVEIARYPEIKVRGYDQYGNKVNKRYLDYVARIVQHEIDHLEGKLIVDYQGTIYVPKKKLAVFDRLLTSR